MFNRSNGNVKLEIVLSKQAIKFLDKQDVAVRSKLIRALDKLAVLQGDIKPLKGHPEHYRLKIDHYRILFEWKKGRLVILVVEINTRTNIKY